MLEQKINTAGVGADAKARWLLCRAYAESLEATEPYPSRGKVWLDQALVTAGSETCRMEVLRQLIGSYNFSGKHDAAMALLESVAGQFSDPQAIAGLEALRQETQKAKADYAVARQQKKAEQAQGRSQLRRRELQRRLAAAKRRGDRARIQRLERMLQEQ